VIDLMKKEKQDESAGWMKNLAQQST